MGKNFTYSQLSKNSRIQATNLHDSDPGGILNIQCRSFFVWEFVREKDGDGSVHFCWSYRCCQGALSGIRSDKACLRYLTKLAT